MNKFNFKKIFVSLTFSMMLSLICVSDIVGMQKDYQLALGNIGMEIFTISDKISKSYKNVDSNFIDKQLKYCAERIIYEIKNCRSKNFSRSVNTIINDLKQARKRGIDYGMKFPELDRYIRDWSGIFLQ